MFKKSFLKRPFFLTASFMLCTLLIPASANAAFELSLAALCPSWGQMDVLNSKCKTCEVMLLFFDAANYMTEAIASTLADPMVKLIAAGFALWLAFQTLVFFSTPATELNPAEFGDKVGKMFVRVIFGVGFISGGCSFVFEYLLEPYLNSVAKLVEAIAGDSMVQSGTPVEYTGPISESTRAAIDGMIGGFAKPLIDMQNVGFGLMCNGLGGIKIPSDEIVDALWFLPIIQLGIPSPLMIAFGAALWALFAFVAFVYALTFMDVMMRFSLVLGFIPFVTLAWVFPATQKYAAQTWRVFLNTALLFVCTSIFLSMIAQMADSSLGGFIGTNDFTGKFLDLSILKGIFILEHFAVNPFPFVIAALLGVIALIGSKIPEDVAEHFTGLGFNHIDNCGRKAVKNICNAIIDIILLIITIVTYGAASWAQPVEGVERTAEAIDKAKKLQETLEKLKKWRERIVKMQQNMNKLANLADGK